MSGPWWRSPNVIKTNLLETVTVCSRIHGKQSVLDWIQYFILGTDQHSILHSPTMDEKIRQREGCVTLTHAHTGCTCRKHPITDGAVVQLYADARACHKTREWKAAFYSHWRLFTCQAALRSLSVTATPHHIAQKRDHRHTATIVRRGRHAGVSNITYPNYTESTVFM